MLPGLRWQRQHNRLRPIGVAIAIGATVIAAHSVDLVYTSVTIGGGAITATMAIMAIMAAIMAATMATTSQIVVRHLNQFGICELFRCPDCNLAEWRKRK